MSWKLSVGISAIVLLAAGGLATLTFFTEPTAEKGGATKKMAMLVDVVEVERGTYQPNIVAQGTVQPARDIVLQPQVSGRITEVAPEFTPGGFVEEGDVLARIEQADFRHVLAQRKSELRQAQSDLAIEKGRQDAAQSEYNYLDEELSADKKALVLRKPQLDAAEQRVEAARASVEQARLNLRRTTIRAPFDAHVIRRDANVGSQVAPSDDMGRLVGVDTYWIGVELPLSKLHLITLPDADSKGSEVRIRNQQAWPKGKHRIGHIFKRVGALDEDTRMARVLAAVSDPLARGEGMADAPELVIGEFVEVTIRADALDDVVRISRDYVREGDTVWVMEDGKLKVRDAEIVTRDPRWAYVSSGLEDGAQVVTTNISTVVDGARLRLDGSDEEESVE